MNRLLLVALMITSFSVFAAKVSEETNTWVKSLSYFSHTLAIKFPMNGNLSKHVSLYEADKLEIANILDAKGYKIVFGRLTEEDHEYLKENRPNLVKISGSARCTSLYKHSTTKIGKFVEDSKLADCIYELKLEGRKKVVVEMKIADLENEKEISLGIAKLFNQLPDYDILMLEN